MDAIAVTSVDDAHGTWEYLDGGSGWTAISLDADEALLLGADTTSRFAPDPESDFAGTATFSFRSWDGVTGTAGTKVDFVDNTAIGVERHRAWIQVAPVNDAPEIDEGEAYAFSPISEDVASEGNVGNTVAEIVVDGAVTDVDCEEGEGIEAVAVTSVDNDHGIWQYALEGESDWSDIAIGVGEALLLGPSDRVRFAPGRTTTVRPRSNSARGTKATGGCRARS